MKFNLYNKFNVNMLTLSTPYQIVKTEKIEDFDDFLSEIDGSKRTEEGRMFSKQKLLVPKIAVVRKKRAPLPRRLTYLLLGETVRAGLVRAERAAILHGDFTGKTHKIPQMSYLRYETKRNAGDF